MSEKKKVLVAVTLDSADCDKLYEISKSQGKTISGLLRKIIQDFFKKS